MANLCLSNYYGTTPLMNAEIAPFSVQIHITAECDQKCQHCYMHDSPFYPNQIGNPLKCFAWMDLVDEYCYMLKEYGCRYGFLAITGGDPLLSESFWPLIEHIDKHYGDYIKYVVMGNSYHIDSETVLRLKQNHLHAYQISIDGVKDIHDHLRKKGSYDDAIRALKLLHEMGIHTVVNMTVSKYNASSVFSLLEFFSSCGFVDEFGFDRMIPTGKGANLQNVVFSPQEYREFLFEVYKKEILNEYGINVIKKEKMWSLLFYELGLSDPLDDIKSNYVRCEAGTHTISFLADGTMFPCRKLEISGGKYPEHTLHDLYFNNDTTKMIQNDKFDTYCNQCEAFVFCRGCPAMKYSVTGSVHGKEPYCWKW